MKSFSNIWCSNKLIQKACSWVILAAVVHTATGSHLYHRFHFILLPLQGSLCDNLYDTSITRNDWSNWGDFSEMDNLNLCYFLSCNSFSISLGTFTVHTWPSWLSKTYQVEVSFLSVRCHKGRCIRAVSQRCFYLFPVCRNNLIFTEWFCSFFNQFHLFRVYLQNHLLLVEWQGWSGGRNDTWD